MRTGTVGTPALSNTSHLRLGPMGSFMFSPAPINCRDTGQVMGMPGFYLWG